MLVQVVHAYVQYYPQGIYHDDMHVECDVQQLRDWSRWSYKHSIDLQLWPAQVKLLAHDYIVLKSVDVEVKISCYQKPNRTARQTRPATHNTKPEIPMTWFLPK